MNIVPIVFAFDNNLALQAAVCVFSLLYNAKGSTTYDIFVLKREGEELDLTPVKRVMSLYPRHRLKIRQVGDTFDSSFEIRGITTKTYYRLLIPSLIAEYDKVIYSDVDVIFRQDLAEIYNDGLGGNILAGVNNLAHIDKDLRVHYEKELHLDPNSIICAGFLIMDIDAMRREGLESKFVEQARKRYKFQDQDVLNIICSGRIKMLPPWCSLLTYIVVYAMQDKNCFTPLWSVDEINEALNSGNIHYNGKKPWKDNCFFMDIWWSYYRMSPIYEEKYYLRFFQNKIDELDRLTLLKRIKILIRFFIHPPRIMSK